MFVERFFAIRRNEEAADIVEQLVGLARAHIKLVYGVAKMRSVGDGRTFQQVEHMGFARYHAVVITSWDGQREDALADIFEIDFYLRDFL